MLTPEKRTRIYLTAAVMGLVATLLLIASLVFDWPDLAKGIPIGLLIVSLITLLRRRLRDEYIELLWNAGTSWAFAAVVLLFLISPFVEGFVDGLNGAVREPAITAAFIGPAALLAFFIGFHLKWLRTSL